MREGDKYPSTLKKSFKKWLKTRWARPVLFLGGAMAIAATAFVVQMPTDKDVASLQEEFEFIQDATRESGPVVEVNQHAEKLAMPVKDASDVTVQRPFYDMEASEEDQQASLVVVNQTYYPNRGIDLVKEGDVFEVTAALSGKVTVVQEDPFIGNAIEIEHEGGMTTKYQAVKDIVVKVGDPVKQGQAIATAGESEMNTEAGTHVHFEVFENGVAVNPLSLIHNE